MTGSIALAHWALRATIKEWRQQLVVTALIGIAVMVTTFANIVMFNVTAPQPDFLSERSSLSAFSLSASETKGSVKDQLQAITDLNVVPEAVLVEQDMPASTTTGVLTLRHQTSDQNVLSYRLALLEGKLPTDPSEGAITKTVADQLGLAVGSDYIVEGSAVAIVGLVEDPTALDRQFLLADKARIVEPTSATIVVEGTSPAAAVLTGPEGNTDISARDDVGFLGTVATLFVLLLVAVLTVASFGLLAKRRLQQIGLLGSIGADPKQIQRGLIIHGAFLGTLAGVVGVCLGLAFSIGVVPQLEVLVNRRISLTIPFFAVILPTLLSTALAVVASWWPARQYSRLSVVDALASRVPRRPSNRGWIPIGMILLIGGVAAIGVAGPIGSDPLAAFGFLIGSVGFVALSPLAVTGVVRLGMALGLPFRMAARMVERNRGRTALGTAAVALAVAIPLSIAIQLASIDKASIPTKMPDNTAIISGASQSEVSEISKTIPSSSLVEVTSQYDDTGILSTPEGDDYRVTLFPAIGESDILELAGLDASVWDTYDVLFFTPGEFRVVDYSQLADEPPEVEVRSTTLEAPFQGFPEALYSPEFAEQQLEGIDPLADPEFGPADTYQWILTSETPLTVDDQIALQQAAAEVNPSISVVASELAEDTSNVRLLAAAASVALALAILLLTVGLVRAEDANDYRTLGALGALPSTNRSIAAAMSIGIGLGGLILGIAIAYLGWFASTADTDNPSPFVFPGTSLAVVVIGTVGLAAALTWFAERPPRSLRTN